MQNNVNARHILLIYIQNCNNDIFTDIFDLPQRLDKR